VAITIWSRDWIGWYCLIPVAASIVWMMVNPLLLEAPRSTRNWASRGVLGERVWAERRNVAIPPQFDSAVPNFANLYSVLGLTLLAYGLAGLHVLPVLAGIAIVHGGKLWYIDRMVLLFEDMKTRDPRYGSWDY
jgi:hypothetical protein